MVNRSQIWVLIPFLLLGHWLQAQTPAEQFVDAMEEYRNEWPQQQLHIAFNQPQYAAGDTIFYQLYLTGPGHNLWKGAQIVEVNLIDQHGEIIKSAKVKTDNGLGNNQLVLPDELEPGYYRFTAFTNWMRNFETSHMFAQTLEVLGEFDLNPSDQPLQFGVEGGKIVEGVPANITVKYAGQEELKLIDSQGNEISTTVTDQYGFARIRLVPASGLSYFVTDSAGERYALPEVQSTGFTINLSTLNDQFYRLRVLGKSAATEQLALIFSSEGKAYYHQMIDAAQPFQTNIDRRTLTPGIHHVSLLNTQGELLASRAFYHAPKVQASVTINPTDISPRGLLGFSLKLDQNNQIEYSVSLLNSEAFDEMGQTHFTERFYLGQRADYLPGTIPEEDKGLVIDQLLTLFPDQVDWQSILSPNKDKPLYGPASLLQLAGKARTASSGEYLPVGSTLMVYLQKDLMRYEVFTGPEGSFILNLLDVYGEDEVFIMAQTPEGNELTDIEIEWVELLLPDFDLPPAAKQTTDASAYGTFHLKQSKIDKSFEFFNTSDNLDSIADTQRSTVPEAGIFDFDNEINVDDFYLFPTMAQFVTEVVRPLRIGQQKGKTIVRMKFLEPDIATGDPLYIIDGIATKNTDLFLGLNPKDVQTISVIKYPKKLSRFGLMARNGLVVVNTKQGNVREPINPNLKILGLSKPLPFSNLNQDWAQKAETPVFKSTIYWNPQFSSLEEAFSITNSDDAAPLFLLIRGISDNRPFSLVKTIPVKQ